MLQVFEAVILNGMTTLCQVSVPGTNCNQRRGLKSAASGLKTPGSCRLMHAMNQSRKGSWPFRILLAGVLLLNLPPTFSAENAEGRQLNTPHFLLYVERLDPDE